jgi:hypothetical protein
MILHAASMAAPLVDQLWLKQWIPTAVSLLSVGIGVWIADRSIRKNRELTLWSFRATSERDHERWILDQKKAEWQELLRAAAHMRRVVSLGTENCQTRAQLIREGLKPAVQELEVTAANCVFLSAFWGDEVKSKRFYSFLRDADLNAEKIDASFIQTQHLQFPNPDLTDQQRERGIAMNILERGDLADTIIREFIVFNDWLRREAAISLGTANVVSGEASPTPASPS